MNINNNQISRIKEYEHGTEPDETADLSVPPFLTAPLFLGDKSLKTLENIYPDFAVKKEKRKLAETLFPKQNSFLYKI
jgi:hypothetical protein